MKLPSYVLPAVAGLLFAVTLHGQSASQRLSLNLGLSNLARQDQLFSPFVHSGHSFTTLGLTWERTKHMTQFVELQVSSIATTHSGPYDYFWHPDPEQFSTVPHNFTFLELNYGLGKSWQQGNATWRAGGVWANNIQALSYNPGPFSSFGYFASFSVGPLVGLSLPVGGKGSLDFSAQAPLLAWVARSPYLVNDDEFIENTRVHNSFGTLANFIGDGSVQFPNKLQQLTFSVRYQYAVGKQWDIGFAYRLQFIRHTEPLTLLSYQHQFCIQISRRWGAE